MGPASGRTSPIQVVSGDRILEITLAAEQEGNLLDDEMVAALNRVLEGNEPHSVLVLGSAGSGFSAGRPHSAGGHSKGPEAARAALNDLVQLNARLAAWDGPVLAFVHGYAHGGALGLLQHCDLVVARDDTRFSFPEITYGLPPALVASYVRRFVDDKAARWMIMTGDEIDAERAREMGLISAVVSTDELAATRVRLIAHLRAQLDAEIHLKAALATFSPWRDAIDSVMTRGVDEVMRWTTRAKRN